MKEVHPFAISTSPTGLRHSLPPELSPQVELAFDQTPYFDSAEPDPAGEFVFDQSLPDELEG